LAPALAGACSSGAQETAPPPAAAPGATGRGTASPAVPITAAPVVEKAMPLDIQAIGSGEAYSNVAVHAQVTGELTSVNFKEGDDVEKGQVLFTFDRRPLEAALQQAEANLARDQAVAANADVQSKRYNDLVGRGIATHEQADAQGAAAASATATVAADKAAVENARVQLQYATISAPLSGRTGALMVHPGNLVRANDTTPLVVINQVAPIYVTFTIPEAQLPDLERYMAGGSIGVRVHPPSDANETPGGRITFIDNAVDQTTGTIKVKASFDNADRRLWPGQFLNVTMTLKTDPRAIVVQSPAVQTGPQGTYVFVVKPDKTVELRTVSIDRTTGAETIIKSGLTAGETVVTDGHLRLVPGSKVTIKSDAPADATRQSN
jgi:multidrug efflux system membrane fusion protein